MRVGRVSPARLATETRTRERLSPELTRGSRDLPFVPFLSTHLEGGGLNLTTRGKENPGCLETGSQFCGLPEVGIGTRVPPLGGTRWAPGHANRKAIGSRCQEGCGTWRGLW